MYLISVVFKKENCETLSLIPAQSSNVMPLPPSTFTQDSPTSIFLPVSVDSLNQITF